MSGCWIDPGGEERDKMCELLETGRLIVFPSFPFLPVVEVTDVLDATAAVLPSCWTVTGVITRFEFAIPVGDSSELGRWWMVELGEAKTECNNNYVYI